MNIIKSSDFLRQAEKYREKRAVIKEKTHLLQKTIEQNTIKEKRDLDNAIKNLNNKVKKILEHPTVKQETLKLQEDQKEMFMSLKKCMDVYRQARDVIMNDTSLNHKEKENYLISLEKKIMARLYSEDEMRQFQNMVSNIIIIKPNQNMLTNG